MKEYFQYDPTGDYLKPLTGKTLLNFQETEQARIAEQEKSAKLAEKLRELGIDPDNV